MRLKEPLPTMRPDMGKCVIERPRRGSKTALSAKARDYGKIVEYDDGPDYDGLTHLPVSRKQEGYYKKLGNKDFSDVLGPRHNYLRRRGQSPSKWCRSRMAKNTGRLRGSGISMNLRKWK